MATDAKTRLLRPKDVMDRIGLSRSGLYQLLAQGNFPKQTRLSHKVAVWRESDIDAWIEANVAARAG